jgi:hypothetical protein
MLCSDQPDEFSIGDRVTIPDKNPDDMCDDGDAEERRGTVIAVNESLGEVTVRFVEEDDTEEEEAAEEEKGAEEEAKKAQGTTKVVSATDVRHFRQVKCSRRQVESANLHALDRFPGARVLPVKLSRCSRIDETRADFVSEFLRNPENVEVGEASIANAKSGGKNKLKTSRCEAHRKLFEEMIKEGLRPVSYGHFYNITKDYEILTADNCCCGHCRDLGMYNFDHCRDVITETNEYLKEVSTPTKEEEDELDKQCKDLVTRTNTQEKFLSTEFFGHLKNTDGCGSHCLTHLLSTHNNSNFCKPCTHPRDDGAEIPKQESMDEYHRRVLNRKCDAQKDWDDACSICEVKNKHRPLLCEYCNHVAHKKCIEGSCCDLPLTKNEEWTCPDCVREHCDQQHSSSCDQCNEFDYIMKDAHRRVDLLRFYESKAETSSEETRHEKSDMLHCRLRVVERNHHLYRAHKIRHRNQHSFKELCLNNMRSDSFYLLVDYWAKLQAQKSSTKTCEGGEVG